MQFDALSAAEVVDNRPEGHVQRAVYGGQFVRPLAAAEGHRAQGDIVLRKGHRQVMSAATQRFRRAGKRHAGGAEQRPRVAVAERGQPLDVTGRFQRERAQRRLDVDENLRHAAYNARRKSLHNKG